MGVNEYIKQLKEFQNYMCITLLLIENFWMKPNENKQFLQQNIDLGTFNTFTSTQSFSSTDTKTQSFTCLISIGSQNPSCIYSTLFFFIDTMCML